MFYTRSNIKMRVSKTFSIVNVKNDAQLFMTLCITNKMPTYVEIQAFVKKTHHRYVKPCHIAHVKSDLRLPMHGQRGMELRKHPCPAEFRPWIEEAFRTLYPVWFASKTKCTNKKWCVEVRMLEC